MEKREPGRIQGLPNFYRAMHYSANRSLAIACRPPVCLCRHGLRRSLAASGVTWRIEMKCAFPGPQQLHVAVLVANFDVLSC